MRFGSTIKIFLFIILFITGLSLGQVGTQIPINPKNIPQFVEPLPHFAYPGARVDATALGTSLVVRMKPTQQIAVSTGTVLATGTVGNPLTPNIGKANFWAYEIVNGINTYGPYWPAHTIIAKRGVPVQVTYENHLFNESYTNVGLVVDQTLHWADPAGIMHSTDPYTGEPPAVVHLHGGEVASEYGWRTRFLVYAGKCRGRASVGFWCY